MRNKNYRMTEDQVLGLGVGIGSVALAAAVGTCIGLTIGKSSIQTKEGTIQPVEPVTQSELIDEVMGDVQVGDTKIFEPGEHYISVRIQCNTNGYNVDDVPGLAINNIPDGYEVYQIVPFDEKQGSGSAIGGYDVWYVNTETVEAIATYNEYYDMNGYYTFGTVVEDTNLLTR